MGGWLEPIQEEEVEQSQRNNHHPDDEDCRPDNHHHDNCHRAGRGDDKHHGRHGWQPDRDLRDNLHDCRDLRGELNNRHQERNEAELRQCTQYDRNFGAPGVSNQPDRDAEQEACNR